jgi:hypothetical protein
MRAYVVESGSVEILWEIEGERVVYAAIGEGGFSVKWRLSVSLSGRRMPPRPRRRFASLLME